MKRQYYNNRSRPRSNNNTRHSNDDSTASTSSGTNSNSNIFEIPGFYYDEEKKRYFKIQPNHQRQANLVTHDTIKHKKHEESVVKSIKKPKNNSFLKNILLNFEIGTSNHRSLYRECNNYIITNLKCKTRVDISDIQNQIDDICSFQLSTNPDHVYFLLNSLLPINEYLLKFVKLNKYSDKFKTEFANVEINQVDYYQCSTKRAYVHDNEYLVKSSTGTLLDNSVNYTIDISRLSLDTNVENHLIETTVARLRFPQEIRTSALNSCRKFRGDLTKFSLGYSDHAAVVSIQADNLNKRSQIDVNTLNSHVFCQRFHPTDGESLIYNGCKKFYILGHDLRQNTKNQNSHILKLDHKSSVIDFLFSKKDPNYIYSTDFTGQVYQWDLRFNQNAICTYNGNFNENSHRKLNLTECEEFIYTVGQDGHTRIWNAKTCDLIKTILTSSPIRGHNLYAEIPNVYLTDNLNLFYAINKCIKLYSL